MCLAVPLKILEISADGKDGTVDMGGSAMTVGLDLVPDARPGDWVLVHAGMAIEALRDFEAEEILDTYREYARSAHVIEPEVDR